MFLLVGAANKSDGRTSPQGEAMIQRLISHFERRAHYAKDKTVACVSGNFFGGKTEAQALFEACENFGLTALVKKTVVLDPLSQEIINAMMSDQYRSYTWQLAPGRLSTNTWENMQRVADYCARNKIFRVVIVANAMHGTYALPLLRLAMNNTGVKTEIGLLNSRQVNYDANTPQPRWRSAGSFYRFSVLTRGYYLLMGLCRNPYLRA